MAPELKRLEESHVRETYRYLRIGLIGAAVLLGLAVIYERALAPCWQGSISSYYYTPARGVFVGALVAVGFSLIVIKGRGWEDLALNLAGMFAPVVAFVPTTNIGKCFSVPPDPSPFKQKTNPTDPDVFADWVVANIENNMWALIAAGILGVLLALFLLWRDRENFLWPFEVGTGSRSLLWGFVIVVGIILGSAVALAVWDDFKMRAHNFAAVGMFVFLALASWINARRSESPWYRRIYRTVAVLMVISAVVIWVIASLVEDWDHAILWLEAIEIALFIGYWWAQTQEHWLETVRATAA